MGSHALFPRFAICLFLPGGNLIWKSYVPVGPASRTSIGAAANTVENEAMGGANESVVIEIGDDAYKQNGVYRPWDELSLAGPGTLSDTSSTPLENLQTRLRPHLKPAPINTPL